MKYHVIGKDQDTDADDAHHDAANDQSPANPIRAVSKG